MKPKTIKLAVHSYRRQIGTLVQIKRSPFKISKKLPVCRLLISMKKHLSGVRNKRAQILEIIWTSDIFHFLADSGTATIVLTLIALAALLSHLIIGWVASHGASQILIHSLNFLEYVLLLDGGLYLLARVIRNVRKYFA